MTLVSVRSEPSTYRPDGPHSWFADLINARVLHGAGEFEDRLRRNQADLAKARRVTDAIEARQFNEAAVLLGFEARVNPTSALGLGGEFDPPAWLIDRFASAARTGRPLADLIGSLPLPPGYSQINIPRMSTGSSAAIQGDGALVSDTDIVTATATSQVVTIAGQVDVSQQLQDLSPAGFDAIAYTDLTKAYNKALETQLISGSGAAGQLLGVTNVASINTISGSGASTFTLLWPLVGQAYAAAGNNRLMPPEACLMAPRRWGWIASSLDSSSRPITSPGAYPHMSDFPVAGASLPVGSVVGVPVWSDGAISAGTAADVVIMVRYTDMFLFESQPRFFAAPNPLSGSLQIRLSLHRYAAAVLNRYPSGIAVVTAIPAPSGF